MTAKIKGPGGKRPGAGRKRTYPNGRRDLYVRLPAALFDAFTQAAMERQLTKNQLMIDLLTNWLGPQQKQTLARRRKRLDKAVRA